MNKGFGDFAQLVYAAIASPWALLAMLVLIAAYFAFGSVIGLPPQHLDLAFFLTLSTFTLVFLIEHEGYRDNAATQVKLDEIIRALDADRSKIGIEQKPPREIDTARDELHQKERDRVG